MLQDVKDLTASGVNKGLNTQYNLLTLQKDQSPNMMDVKINYDGSLEKRLGSNTQNSVIFSNSAISQFLPNTTNLLNSLVSFWKFDEANGIRSDAIGSVPLLDKNNVSFNSGIKNQAALFDITKQQCLYSNNANSLSGNKDFSISSWFYLSSTAGTKKRTIISKIGSSSSNYRPSSVSTQPTHWWKLSESSGNRSDSASSNQLVMTDFNSVLSETGVLESNAALFSGANYLSSVASNDWKFGTEDFSVSFWFKVPSFSSINYLIDCGVYGGGGWQIVTENSTTIGLNLGLTAGNFRSVTVPAMTTDTWYYLVVKRVSGFTKTFLNNIEYDSVSDSFDYQPARELDLANWLYTYNGVHYGLTLCTLQDVAIWKGYALSNSEIENLYNAYYLSNNNIFEYSLYVDTDNLVTFDVSSSSNVVDGRVKASSFGTVNTGTWYNSICWLDSTNNSIGVSLNLAFNTSSYSNGIYVGTAPITVGAINAGNGGNFLSGRIDDIGYWDLVLDSSNRAELYNSGSGNTYQPSFLYYPWASFDFGASSIRWLTCAAGTGVYASSNLGVNWVVIATDRTATYQYFDRSKNVEILTSDAYDTPLYWAGSVGTFASIIGTSTPLCKYSINFQGFLILLNSSTRKRSFNYIDENFQLSSTGWLNFDLPSSADDEITAVFILRRYLYVSTRYKIYRVSYVGGNPDWQFVEVKSWGFIPRTPKKVVISNQQQGQTSAYSIGEVVVGLTWDRKLRIFDGSGDQILSNNIEKDNGMCDFALDKISYFGSGPVISFAEIDPIPNVYRLCVAIGQDSQNTTHFINYDGRSQALYPYSNMKFNCMCVAESANRQFLMAFDRNGYCHMMDSGNLDGNTTPINDLYESPLMYEKTPSQSSKGHKTDLFFTNTTSGTLYYEDRIDFSNEWKFRKKFVINGSNKSLMHYESIDVQETYNTYQYRISTSSGQSTPYRLQRYDHFTKGLGIGRNA